jgi:hypothetical protein
VFGQDCLYTRTLYIQYIRARIRRNVSSYILVDWRVFDNTSTLYPALVLHYSEGAGCCVFLHKLHGKVTTAQVDRCTVYQKKYPNTGIPCTAVRVFGLKTLFWKVRSTTLRIIKTYNPYTKILNFVLLIWEERNSGRYEHARACRERARAPRAPKKIHQPSTAIKLFDK